MFKNSLLLSKGFKGQNGKNGQKGRRGRPGPPGPPANGQTPVLGSSVSKEKNHSVTCST